MTKVRVMKTAGQIAGFEMSGHSGYADQGEDIVCAAISAISQTAVIGIVDVLGIDARCMQDDRRGRLSLTMPNGCSDERADAVLRTMVAGLEQIERQYPDFIRIMFFETEVTSL